MTMRAITMTIYTKRCISTRFYIANGQWIYAPAQIIVVVHLEDGRLLHTLAEIHKNKDGTKEVILSAFGKDSTVKAQIIVIKIPNYGTIPTGFQGAGNKAWTFIDEIIVE